MVARKQGNKKRIVISAVNFFTGGPLTILQECLACLDQNQNICSSYSILALVYDASLLPHYKNIEVRSFAKPRGSWLQKLLHEYVHSKKISKEKQVYLWFSLHDMTPSVIAERRAVYCHNPAPLYKPDKRERELDKSFTLFTMLYKYLYSINIKKNNYIVVQQDWIRKEFAGMFHLPVNRIIVAHPDIAIKETNSITDNQDHIIRFLYPALPRVFKNFEVVINAVDILDQETEKEFEVIFTIDGTENKYADFIKRKAGNLPQIKFLGLQNKEAMNDLYQQCSCVLFPSKLETWGLPITEAKLYDKPLLVADLPYARETVGTYDKVSFFGPNDAGKLSMVMKELLQQKLIFEGNKEEKIELPFSKNWNETFQWLLQ